MRVFLSSMLVISIFFTGCSDKDEQTESKNVIQEVKKPTIDESKIILTDTSGTNISLKIKENGFIFEGYENKVVLINFLTTWCPPCDAQIPHLNNLSMKYKENLIIISVLLEDKKDNKDVINFINDNDIAFTVVNSAENFRLSKHIGGVKSIPYMVIYDKNGDYFKHYIGATPEEMLEADLKKVL